MGEDPTGFIAKRQALSRRDRTAEQIATEIALLLADDLQTAGKFKSAKIALGLVSEADDSIPS